MELTLERSRLQNFSMISHVEEKKESRCIRIRFTQLSQDTFQTGAMAARIIRFSIYSLLPIKKYVPAVPEKQRTQGYER